MIVVSFGVRKSGSTLAAEMVRAVLELNGFPREVLPESLVRRSDYNALDRWSDEAMARLVECTRGSAALVKTHGPPDPLTLAALFRHLELGDVKIHLVYRDPRDTVLSMLDERAKRGKSCALDEVIDRLRANVRKLRRWGAFPALRLCYDDFAFDRALGPQLLADDLGLSVDPDEVWRLVEQRHTRRNVARPHRHRTEMAPEVAAPIEAAVPDFLSLVEQGDLGFFDRPDPSPRRRRDRQVRRPRPRRAGA